MKIDAIELTLFDWTDIPSIRYTTGAAAAAGRSNLGLLTVRTDEGIEGNAFLGGSLTPADADAAGTIQMTLDGSSYDGPKSLELPVLTGGHVRELRYSFRYLQTLEQEISVPLALKPTQLQVDVQSTHKDLAPLSQTFLWTVEAAP